MLTCGILRTVNFHYVIVPPRCQYLREVFLHLPYLAMVEHRITGAMFNRTPQQSPPRRAFLRLAATSLPGAGLPPHSHAVFT